MKVGLKFFPDDIELMKDFEDIFDFYEILVLEDFDYRKIRDYTDKEITVHVEHHQWGFDPGDPKFMDLNTRFVAKAVEAADFFDSKIIVMHPGLRTDKSSFGNMVEFFRQNNDKRFLFENCPIQERKLPEEYMLAMPDEMEKFLKIMDADMLLDFAHAVCSSNTIGRDPYKTIEGFMKLKPKAFHVSGIDITGKNDVHKHLFEVDNDFRFLKDLPKDTYITLETGKENKDLRETHIKNIGVVRQCLNEKKL